MGPNYMHLGLPNFFYDSRPNCKGYVCHIFMMGPIIFLKVCDR